jgi:putative selenate reductase
MLIEDGRVRSNLCFRMELGEKDTSGRPRPIKIDGSEFELNVDCVISAIGQRVNLDFFPEEKLEINPATHETQLENVFAGGDAVRGASTLIKAIADGKKVAESIKRKALKDFQIQTGDNGKVSDLVGLQQRRARREFGARLPEIGFDERSGFDMVIETMDETAAQNEAARCLQCDELCNVCVTVCPNRANIGFTLEPRAFKVQQARSAGDGIEITDLETVRVTQRHQILNLGDYCNECGNCTTFCPTSGSPYLDKARFHVTAESFASSQRGYYFTSDNRLECKQNDHHASLEITDDGFFYEDEAVRATLGKDFTAQNVAFKGTDTAPVNLRQAAEMAILCQAVRVLPQFAAKN